MRTRSISLALVILLLSPYVHGQTTLDTVFTPPGYEDGSLRGTIYMPKFPNGAGVVLVPGTGMVRSQISSDCNILVAQGYTAMAIDCPTLGGELGVYPKSVRAVKIAAQFLRRNAARFSVASGRIVGVGYSAGAIYWGESIIWDNDYKYFQTDSTVSDHLDAAVLFYGLYDTQHHLDRGDAYIADTLLNHYFGYDSTLRATKGNCIVNVTRITTPVLLIHSTNDIRVEWHQSAQLDSCLNANGKPSHLDTLAAGHGFLMSSIAGIKDSVLAFLQRTVLWDVAYFKSVQVEPLTPRIQVDTVHVRLGFANPQLHSMAITAILSDAVNGISDSLTGLFKDTTWEGWYVPTREGVISVNLRANDIDAGTVMHLPNSAFFATGGPVRYGDYRFERSSGTVLGPGRQIKLMIGLKNRGTTGILGNVSGLIGQLRLGDLASRTTLSWPALFPGDSVYFPSAAATIGFDPERSLGETASFLLKISSNGVEFWRDTMSFVLTGLGSPTLASPGNGFSYHNSTVTMLWFKPASDIDRYGCQVATDSLFASTVATDSLITDTSYTVQSLQVGRYWWRVREHNVWGWGPFSNAWMFDIITGVVWEGPLPQSYTLMQNYPNPFNPSTTIRYALPRRSQVSVAVFNTLGQQVAELVHGDVEAGYHEVRFVALSLSTGVYFYRLTAGTFVQTRKLLLLR